MLTRSQYFPEQKRDEQIVLFIRSHWMSFLPWIIFISAMIIAPLILVVTLRDNIIQIFPVRDRAYHIIGLSAYLLIVLAIFLTAWISFYLNVMIVTPEHLVDIRQNGLYNRKVSEQSLLRVQDVSAHMEGFFQTFFHFGTIYVETAGEAPNFKIPNIPDPNRVANKILKLHEDLVKESGFKDKDMAQGIGLEKTKNQSVNVAATIPPKMSEVPELPKEEVELVEEVEKNEVNTMPEKKDFKESMQTKENDVYIEKKRESVKKEDNDRVELKDGEVIKL